jgi:tRNA A-37 threonylcarbamoyl transferase component Bud32
MEENAITSEVENCRECGNPMDVTSFAPYSEVQCPACHQNVHVKSDVGGYEITGRQGVGGMSLVFQAVDKTLGRKVAIKLLNESYSTDAKRIEEFEKEAKITAAISHPHVVRVYTVGQAYGRYFIAMELVEGESLEQRMAKSGKLGEEMVTRLAIEVVEGLKSAHEAGLIHRDMKPGNILLDTNGRAKIVDFGLALVTSGGKAIAEEIWATPFYVPPETLKLQEEDLRSDIYALAASLYHALAGEPPFTTETKSTSELLRIKAEIPKLAKKAKGVSDPMCAIIDKAMAYEAGERFQSYDQLLKALKQLELFYRTGAEPESFEAEAQSSKGRRSRRKGFPVVPVVAGVLLVGGLGGMLLAPKKEVLEAPIEQTKVPVVEDRSSAQEAQRVFIATELKTARSLLKQQEYMAANERYLKLALTPEIPTETVIWVGLQSASSAWLDGNSSVARDTLESMTQHLGGLRLSAQEQEVLAVMEELRGYDSVALPSDLPESLESTLLFVAGQKEWQQGKWEHAKKLFKSAKRETLQEHRSKLNEYLSDYRLLEPYLGGVEVVTIDEADVLLNKFASLESELKTRGRAPFNLAQWSQQVESKKHILVAQLEEEERKAEENERVAQQAWESAKSDMQNGLASFEFGKAVDAIAKAEPQNDEDSQWLGAVSFFVIPANELYATSSILLKDEVRDFVVLDKSGELEFDKLLGADENGLTVREGRKQKQRLKWSEVSPYSMWELHRSISNKNVPEELREKRRLQLACYFYLTGLEDKAQMLTGKLIESNEGFADKWKASALLVPSPSSD